MGKSEIKQVLLTSVPECFTRPGQEEDLVTRAVVQDTSVNLMAMEFLRSARRGDKHAVVTLDEAVENLFIGSIHAIQDDGCMLWVHCFDKPTFVSAAKQPEQRKRDSSGKPKPPLPHRVKALSASASKEGAGAPANASTAPRNPMSAYSATVAEWTAAVQDRATKGYLVKHLCDRARALIPGWMRRARIPAEKWIVIDYDSMPAPGGNSTAHDGGGCYGECAVLCSEGEITDPSVVHMFRNGLGEFDVAHVHHLRNGCCCERLHTEGEQSAVIVKSIDSDIVLVDMLQTAHDGTPSVLRVETTLPASLSDTSSRQTVYVDPRKVAEWVEAALGEYVEDPLGWFTKTYALSGGDFVQGVPGYGNGRFIDNCLQWLFAKGRVEGSKLSEVSGERAPTAFLASLANNYLSGSKRASKTCQREERWRQVDSHHRGRRADWVLKYWRFSGYREELVPSHLGMGFALQKGAHVYTEDLGSI